MAEESNGKESTALVEALRHTLIDIAQNPYPYVPNPEGCKKRASVALVIRIRPKWGERPPATLGEPDHNTSIASQIESFFAQPWVQNGDAEAVFIKRAARDGDRWTSHVALPGGKRDPEDADDKATAIRETSEEIGLDLNSPNALFVGNLPERVVSTSWGKVPLMVLCPFLFIWTKPDLPPLALQPAEVASTHWVPLRVMLSPSVRSYEDVDVSDRFARQGGFLIKTLIRATLGKMRFSAIRLIPSESLFCSSEEEFFPSDKSGQTQGKSSLANRVYNWYLGDHARPAQQTKPLLLWGLTLGILADFLDQLPPYNSVKLWNHPTFTSPDTRFIVSIMTQPLKKRNQARLECSGVANQTAIDSQTEAVTPGDKSWTGGGKNADKSYAVGLLLEGYYDMVQRAIWVSASLRLLATVAFVWQVVRKYRRNR
ncbi:hypothetical protein BP6252_09937 [Coleophoma cylindrospora]|uniref:Nudix hydrolase domain-containing protein n=1 Tax=Coleophoma cylindrospora TaxID=1849047 RepID=A0A3D8QWY6_9HELO|nr:hypothetical protein BP6252_09937 [Coleophoma cylindrospora]